MVQEKYQEEKTCDNNNNKNDDDHNNNNNNNNNSVIICPLYLSNSLQTEKTDSWFMLKHILAK